MMENYHDNMKAYRAQKLPQRIQKFEACATPTEEIECDLSLFLQKYFLDKDGNRDPTKTPGLILLSRYHPRLLALTARTDPVQFLALAARIDPVPALHVASGGLEGASNVMVIGWNRERVRNKAHDIDMQQTGGRGILRLSDNWDSQMRIHRNYVEERRSRAKTSDPEATTSFYIDHVTGVYIVSCDYVQHYWPVLSKQLHLRFFPGGRLAIIDLGIVFGLMVLGKTQVAVTKVVQNGTWNANLIGAGEMNDDVDGEDMSSEEGDSYDERESGSSDNLDHNMSDEPDYFVDLTSDQPDNFVDLTSDRPTKRQKSENGHPRRLYFQWRGYNTVTGAIKFDPQNCNTGYLDFADDDATTLKGKICMDVRTTVDFHGYKASQLAGPLTMDWNALSHLASERAKVREYIW